MELAITKSLINSSEKRESIPTEWEQLLTEFAQTHKKENENITLDMPRIFRELKKFPTGSQYLGTWDILGMNGKGIYTFPNGVIYEGEFKDGLFHGVGELRYPCGATLFGKWHEGDMRDRTLSFADGVYHSERNWRYCQNSDRRFLKEHKEGPRPGGNSYKTSQQPPRDVPPGYYDTGDGFYDPQTSAVYCDDLFSINRSPSEREQKWIMENCRTSPESVVGPRTDLYEEWSTATIKPKQSHAQSVTFHSILSISEPDRLGQDNCEIEIKMKEFEDDSDVTSTDYSE